MLEESFEELDINDAVWYLTKNGKGFGKIMIDESVLKIVPSRYHVYFPCDVEESDNVLEYFCGKRIGIQKETFIG